MDPTVNPESIVNQLNRILGSDQFAVAFRIKKLLKFLVDETIAGRAEQIKAYTIALNVFDRGVNFDPQSDPIVRINAGRLRRHLDDFYQNCGPEDTVRITIPKGAYVPRFDRIQPSPKDRSVLDKEACEVLLGVETNTKKSERRYTEPVIAVLPFKDFEEGQTEITLQDGFSDELSSGLALFQEIRVIDYYSMARFRDQPIGIRKIGQQLGVDYLISGSIKAADKSIKIRVSLSDAQTGVQVWTKVFDHSLSADSLSETLSEITNRIIGAVASEFGAIFIDRKKGILDGAYTDLTHYEVVFMHRHAQLTGNWEYGPRIKKDLEQVLTSDPEFAPGWALLGEIHCDRHAHEYSKSDGSLKEAYSCAMKAIHYDPYCQYGHYIMTYVHLLRREPDKVIEASKQVFDLNPNAAFTIGGTALWLCIAGDFDHGLDLMNHSIQLNPYYPGWFHHAPYLFHLKQGNYEKALAEAEKFNMPEYYMSFLDKAVATGLLGRTRAAKDLLNRVVELHPDFANHPRYYVSAFVLEEDVLEKMIEGLEKAGLHDM
jgi:adenylate cyclase